MEIKGKIHSLTTDVLTGDVLVTFSTSDIDEAREFIAKNKDTELRIKATKWREKRSLDANGLLWACIGDIAKAMDPPADRWQIYLLMLKRYGQYTHIVCTNEAVAEIQKQWREVEVVGDCDINGEQGKQLLCFFGSSTYNTKEFSTLLNGVISEMQEIGIKTPASEDMRRVIAEMENKKHE